MSSISVDVSQLKGLADKLTAVDAAAIGAASLASVNSVTERAYTAARKRMIAGINLPDAYLRERMSITPASDPERPVAVIRAAYKHTVLGRYAPKQLTRPASGRAKGDSSRGIPAGLRGAGVSIEVTRGSRKPISNAFIMPLKNGNGIGVFVRDPGSKSPRILYGPSVYQLFRATIDVIKGSIEDDLEATTISALGKLVKDALR